MEQSDQQWTSIDSQDDLDRLESAVVWEDSETVGFYGSSRNERYFPGDVSRSGYCHPNLHLFCQVDSRLGDFVHLVLIDCDWYFPSFVASPYFKGRVDALRRVEVSDGFGSTQMRCSRLVYQFLWDDGEIDESSYLARHILVSDG